MTTGAGALTGLVGGSRALRAAAPIATATGQPDVLVLMTDQWNPRDFGYEGDPDVHTPHLDALAAESLNFTRCYTNCPVCMPARACMVSGLYPHNTGLWSNSTDFYLRPGLTPLFNDMRGAGYATAQIGKFHWMAGQGYRREYDSLESYHRAIGLDHPGRISPPAASAAHPAGVYQDYLRDLGLYEEFRADILGRLKHDQYEPRAATVTAEQHCDWFTADRSIDYLREQPKNRPYFLVTSFPGPHVPLDGMGRYLAMYDPDHIGLAPNVRPFQRGGEMKNLADIRAMRANYLAKMTMIDDCIGRIITTLKERGTWDNTIVVFTADHGDMMGAQGRVSKTVFYEESARVPLLIRMPDRSRAGQRTNALVQFGDVYASVLDAVGGERSPGNFAQSFMPVVRGASDTARETAFSEISHGPDFEFMVRDDRYKWFKQFGREHLFDLEDDPYEMNNLADSITHRGVIDEAKDRLSDFLMNTQINHSSAYRPLGKRVQAGGPVEAQY